MKFPPALVLSFGINNHKVHMAFTSGTERFYYDTYELEERYEIESKNHTTRGWWAGWNILPGKFGIYFDYGKKYYGDSHANP